MNKLADLHIHTSVSDGMYQPKYIVKLAQKLGIHIISITDHDSTGGIDEAVFEGLKRGIEVIPGIEMSTEYKSELHILGYFIDEHNPELCEYVKLNEERLRIDVRKAVLVLNRMGFKLDLKRINKKFGKINTASLIDEMVGQQYLQNVKEGYELYFGRGKPAYIRGFKLYPYQCIELIKKAGGVVVLAHLNRISDDYKEWESLIVDLTNHGLDGLECYYPTYTPEQQQRIEILAEKNNLFKTGGSDFHGDNEEKMKLGINSHTIPSCVVGNLKKAWKNR